MSRIILLAVTTIPFLTAPIFAQDEQADAEVSLTVYNSGSALVSKRRTVEIPAGVSRWNLRDVGDQVIPDSLHLTGEGLELIEAGYQTEPLSPSVLLEHYVGQTVTLIRTEPDTGAEQTSSGKLLSAQGPVFEVEGRIETGGANSPWRIAFDQLPEGLHAQPVLTALVKNEGGGAKPARLSYLTGGLSWQASYVAALDVEAAKLYLTGFAGMNNNTGVDFEDVRLRLVAGELNRAGGQPVPYERRLAMAGAADSAPQPESAFEYHVFEFARAIDLDSGESRQLRLLQADGLKVKREYRVDASRGGWRYAHGEQRGNAAVWIEFENDTGQPMPAGLVRFYSAQTPPLLLGEDRMPHTPEREKVELMAGNAFNITARRRELDTQRIDQRRRQAERRVTLKNTKKKSVQVRLIEPMPGDWRITEENLPHEKLDANRAAWTLSVPAGGEAELRYTLAWQ